jgi:hypothetical protein
VTGLLGKKRCIPPSNRPPVSGIRGRIQAALTQENQSSRSSSKERRSVVQSQPLRARNGSAGGYKALSPVCVQVAFSSGCDFDRLKR